MTDILKETVIPNGIQIGEKIGGNMKKFEEIKKCIKITVIICIAIAFILPSTTIGANLAEKSKQNRLKSAIPIGAELRGITQIFKTAILAQKKGSE